MKKACGQFTRGRKRDKTPSKKHEDNHGHCCITLPISFSPMLSLMNLCDCPYLLAICDEMIHRLSDHNNAKEVFTSKVFENGEEVPNNL